MDFLYNSALPFSIISGRFAGFASKALYEVSDALKAAKCPDLIDREKLGLQHIFCISDANESEVG